jgi:hypothetical protein
VCPFLGLGKRLQCFSCFEHYRLNWHRSGFVAEFLSHNRGNCFLDLARVHAALTDFAKNRIAEHHTPRKGGEILNGPAQLDYRNLDPGKACSNQRILDRVLAADWRAGSEPPRRCNVLPCFSPLFVCVWDQFNWNQMRHPPGGSVTRASGIRPSYSEHRSEVVSDRTLADLSTVLGPLFNRFAEVETDENARKRILGGRLGKAAVRAQHR